MLLLYYIIVAFLILLSILFLVSVLGESWFRPRTVETFVGKISPSYLRGFVDNVVNLKEKLGEVKDHVDDIEHKVSGSITHVKDRIKNIAHTLSVLNKTQIDDSSYNKEVAVLFDDNLLSKHSEQIKKNVADEYGYASPSEKNIRILNFVFFNDEPSVLPKPYNGPSINETGVFEGIKSYSSYLAFINDEIKDFYDVPVISDDSQRDALRKLKKRIDDTKPNIVLKKIKTFRDAYLTLNKKTGKVDFTKEFSTKWITYYPEHSHYNKSDIKTNMRDYLRRHVIALTDTLDLSQYVEDDEE